MDKFFKLKENNTTVGIEVAAGITTFFTMSYILIVNPDMLSAAGLEWGAVFMATVIASAIGTLIMGLFANVPYALAPGMGLNAFFVYTIVFAYGFTPYEALAMVFVCGVINILITVTKVRKLIVKSIPLSLQNAIGGGIGIFIAYIGLLNVSALVNVAGPDAFPAFTPGFAAFNSPGILLFIFGLILTIVLMVKKVKGSILIGIVTTFGLAIITGQVDLSGASLSQDYSTTFSQFSNVIGKAITVGLPTLFSDVTKLPVVLTSIFAFSLSDTFDTIGTFIGTGRRTGIFSAEDEAALENSSGFSSKMDKALFADSIATSIGALLGTSNVTTYIESSSGIEQGGRTGLTAVTVAVCFLASIILSPVISLIPSYATAPALVVVGVLMAGAFMDIKWTDFEEAVPAFFAAVFIALAYSISDGIAVGFIFYTIIKLVSGKFNEINGVLWVSTVLFIIKFVISAL
jgi:Permeases